MSDARFSTTSAVLAVALTLVAGYVDAIGYLKLGHVYIANMSGNSIAVGIGAGWRDTARLWRYALPIASFILGLVLSRSVVGWGIVAGWRSVAAAALGLEVVALAAFLAFPQSVPGVLFGGAAMGIQAATLSRFNGATVYTSFVTGSLVRASEHLADVAGALLRHGKPNPDHVRNAVWFSAVWCAYVAGAATGTVALEGIGPAALVVAIVTIAALACLDFVAPYEIDRDIE